MQPLKIESGDEVERKVFPVRINLLYSSCSEANVSSAAPLNFGVLCCLNLERRLYQFYTPPCHLFTSMCRDAAKWNILKHSPSVAVCCRTLMTLPLTSTPRLSRSTSLRLYLPNLSHLWRQRASPPGSLCEGPQQRVSLARAPAF